MDACHSGAITRTAFRGTAPAVDWKRVLARMVERLVYDVGGDTPLSLALRLDGKQLALGRFDGVLVLLDEDLETTVAKLRSQGVQITSEPQQNPYEPGKIAAEFRDSVGNRRGAARPG